MRIQLETNITELRARILDARSLLPSLIHDAANELGMVVVEDLKTAAPQGKGESSPPGDAPGFLADSFFVQEESVSEESTIISVQTTQPQKLEYVVKGRGEVRPKVKRALYWEGLSHPVRRAGPTKANDFVSPVVDNAPTADEGLQMAFDEVQAILEGA